MSFKPRIFQSMATAMRDVSSAARAMPVVFTIMFVILVVEAAVSQSYRPVDPKHVEAWSLLAYAVASSLVIGLFATPFAILIHRRIILGEHGRIGALAGIRDRVADFYIACVALQLAFLVPVAAVTAAAQSGMSGWIVGALVVFVLAGFYCLLRLILLFPAIAVDGPDKNLASAFRRSRGLALRAFLIALLLSLAAEGVFAALGFAAFKLLPDLYGAVSIAADALKNLLMTAASVAIASRFYLWRRDADASGSPEALGGTASVPG